MGSPPGGSSQVDFNCSQHQCSRLVRARFLNLLSAGRPGLFNTLFSLVTDSIIASARGLPTGDLEVSKDFDEKIDYTSMEGNGHHSLKSFCRDGE